MLLQNSWVEVSILKDMFVMDQFAGMMSGMGVSDGMVRDYVDMFTAKNEGMDTFEQPLARDQTPTTFEDWCRRELAPVIKA